MEAKSIGKCRWLSINVNIFLFTSPFQTFIFQLLRKHSIELSIFLVSHPKNNTFDCIPEVYDFLYFIKRKLKVLKEQIVVIKENTKELKIQSDWTFKGLIFLSFYSWKYWFFDCFSLIKRNSSVLLHKRN